MDEPLVSGGIMLLICLGVTVVMQCSFFAVAYTCQFDKVTDLAGALNFIVLAVLSLVLQDVYDARAIVATCMQVAWALRLGSFLLLRVLKRGKDERFDEMRANCLAFFGFWVFQILWVFLVSLPVVLANSSDEQVDGSFGEARDVVGIVVWAVGMGVEYAADASKSAFNKDPKNKGKLLRSGVWKYSRHPNYFGEILCWVGVTVLASANFGSNRGETWFYYVSCLSPVFTFLVLMFLSGVPLAEERYDERFGLDPDYLEYKRSTSPLVPLPPGFTALCLSLSSAAGPRCQTKRLWRTRSKRHEVGIVGMFVCRRKKGNFVGQADQEIKFSQVLLALVATLLAFILTLQG